jgi:predicted phage terminase large subunit-like protein
MSFSQREYEALLRTYLPAFLNRAFVQLNPGIPYLPNAHIDVMADRLQQVLDGKIKRLIINVPPRSLKSLTGSVAFPAYILGHLPSARTMCVSYAQPLAEHLAAQCRAVMTSDWYRVLFPATRLAPSRSAVADFATTKHGGRYATSIGGSVTGRGAEFVILDDPLKPEEALSDTQRNRVNDWFINTLLSRLNDKQNSAIVLIMQRLHEDDLVGYVQTLEPWEILSFPAIAEAEEVFEYNTPFGPDRYVRSPGGILHPEREPAEVLDQIRRSIGEMNFAGQYQQSPAPAGGGLIKLDWLKRFDLDAPPKFEQIVQSWDTGNKATELSDYSVCTTWGMKHPESYLLDVYRERVNYPDLKHAVARLAAKYKPDTLLIEDKGSGTQLIQELRRDGVRNVQAYTPKGEKTVRIHAQTGAMEGGFVYVPEKAPWLGVYLHELAQVPNGKFWDQVDSTSQALEWMTCGQKGMGLFLFYRDLYMQRQRELGLA